MKTLKVVGITTALLGLVYALTFSCNPPTGPGGSPTPTPTPANVSLKLHPKNKRYFISNGKPILIASHGNLVPTSKDLNPDELIKFIVDSKQNHTRIWHLLPWDRTAVWPWERSVQCCFNGESAGNKYDLSKWNQEYFNLMKHDLEKTRGIHAEIMLFDRVGMSPTDITRWQSNPWAKENNINGLETRSAFEEGTPQFYDLGTRPHLFDFQNRYVQKLIDETVDYTVFYEIENEHWARSTREWPEYWSKMVKDYLKSKGKEVLLSYSSLEDDLETAYNLPNIDIINKHFGGEAEGNPDMLNGYIESRWARNKAINIDEFANGVSNYDLLRKEAWIIVMSGGHFHIEDADPASKPLKVTESIRRFIELTDWNFWEAHPKKNYSSGAYCMISDGFEYACYYASGGNKNINLPAGKYKYDWFDPINNGVNKSETFDHTGGVKTLTAPFDIDWVLHVRRVDGAPSPLPSPSPISTECTPYVPSLDKLKPVIHNHPEPDKWILDVTAKTNDDFFCKDHGFTGSPCALGQEGDPMRLICETAVLGTDPEDGRPGPHWAQVSGDGTIRKHPDNAWLAIVRGTGTFKACGNKAPILCGEITIQ